MRLDSPWPLRLAVLLAQLKFARLRGAVRTRTAWGPGCDRPLAGGLPPDADVRSPGLGGIPRPQVLPRRTRVAKHLRVKPLGLLLGFALLEPCGVRVRGRAPRHQLRIVAAFGRSGSRARTELGCPLARDLRRGRRPSPVAVVYKQSHEVLLAKSSRDVDRLRSHRPGGVAQGPHSRCPKACDAAQVNPTRLNGRLMKRPLRRPVVDPGGPAGCPSRAPRRRFREPHAARRARPGGEHVRWPRGVAQRGRKGWLAHGEGRGP